MSKAKLFPSEAADIEKQFAHLRPIGAHLFGGSRPTLMSTELSVTHPPGPLKKAGLLQNLRPTVY